MSDDELNPSYVAREISPDVENEFSKAFTATFKTIFETRGIYQNVEVGTEFVANKFVKHNPDQIVAEFEQRPIAIVSPLRQRYGLQPVGTNLCNRDFNVAMPLPELFCEKCKRVTPFTLEHATTELRNRMIKGKRHQSIAVPFLCSVCESHILFVIVRKGLKLQLCGRSAPYRPKIGKEWPDLIVKIVQDALQSVGEGDVNAGYYHLRTAQEHLMKSVCSIDIATEIKGTDLCSQYNGLINQEVVRSFPSMVELYRTLSLGLHTRKTTVEEFQGCLSKFSKHLRAVQLYAAQT